MERIGAVADAFGQRMHRIDDEGGNFAKKLVIAREFAKALAEPADALLRVGQEYSASLVELDPAILSLIRLIDDDPAQASPDEVHELVVQIRQLARDARTNTSELRDLVRVLDQTRRMSRELAPPIDKMKQGLRQVIDGQALFDEWERRFAELDERENGPERGGSTPAQD